MTVCLFLYTLYQHCCALSYFLPDIKDYRTTTGMPSLTLVASSWPCRIVGPVEELQAMFLVRRQ